MSLLYSEIFEYALILLSIILVSKFFLFAVFFFLHVNKSNENRYLKLGIIPEDYRNRGLVSVLVPCYNEEKTLKNCINSLINQIYSNYEIIIINDGSIDNTAEIARNLVRENKNIRFVAKENGGKASALNMGLSYAQGNIVICMDADSIFRPDTIIRLISNFNDDSVGAVCGNIKVVNRDNQLTKNQALEYITGLNIERRSFDLLNCIQVISGAIGAFRKDAIEKVNGYSSDTLVEDMDLTIAIGINGYKVVYDEKAIAYTEVPENIKGLYKQRYRWSYGLYQVLYKYKDFLFRKKGGNLGLLGLPYILIAPIVYFIASLFFFLILIKAILSGVFISFLFAFLVSLVLEFVLLFYVFQIDQEDKKLLGLLIVQYIWYRHFITFINLIALLGFVFSRQASWNKLERLGKNFVYKST